MSRLEIASPKKAKIVMEGLYKDLERRIESSPPGLCPVDMARAFLELCHAQTCGKCVPCRIGLGQLNNFIREVLDGKATMKTLDIMEQTALSIMESADCAIGYEAANMVYKGLIGYRDDYVEHIQNGRCTCTYNQPVPCVSLCPAHVDIPGYVALVGEGRYADAIRLLRKDNPFPTTCGFICEHPCEARCRRNMVDDSINIRGLKRVAADFAGEVDPPQCAPDTGKKIAILGGGPGGLSAAYYLQLMGHQTTVYEMLPKLGGMLRYGIPNYRLPKDRLDDDIRAILKTGVQVKNGLKIGQDITIQQLRQEYDVVLITIGASTDKKLGLENEDADGILSAVQFLRNVGKNQIMDLTGKEVAVIGGGNVSMDAVRTAKRLGAKKVSIVYRRRVADMTALPGEIDGAVAEGIELQTLKAPSSIDVDENVSFSDKKNKEEESSGQSESLIGVLSSQSRQLSYLNSIEVGEESEEDIRMITFSRKSFPQSVEAFQGLDGIIIDSFDTGQLSKEQKRALRKWVKKSGGKLLLTGGSQQEGSKDSLEGIGKNFGIVQEGVEVSTSPGMSWLMAYTP